MDGSSCGEHRSPAARPASGNAERRPSPPSVRLAKRLTGISVSADTGCMPSRKHPAPSPETIEALERYALEHGPHWRERLRSQWGHASAPPILHALRNTHGPTWLGRFKLPSEAKPPRFTRSDADTVRALAREASGTCRGGDRPPWPLARCPGEAHSNIFIDGCSLCLGTLWGFVWKSHADVAVYADKLEDDGRMRDAQALRRGLRAAALPLRSNMEWLDDEG